MTNFAAAPSPPRHAAFEPLLDLEQAAPKHCHHTLSIRLMFAEMFIY